MPPLSRRHFTVASLALAGRPSFAQAYRVINLMPDYWAFHDRAQGLTAEAAFPLFLEMVVRRHPEAYAAAVIGLDASKPYEAELQRRWVRVDALLQGKSPLIRELSESIARDLPRYEARFRETFPDLAYTGDVYFMHSLGGFDGATRRIGGKEVLLFGLDLIAHVYGKEADPQPFFHHELFHIYHSQFGTGRDEGLVSALWREGLATWVAQALNPGAGGVSIFGLPRSTPDRVHAALPQLAAELRAKLDDRSGEEYARWFLGGREDAEPPARAGYTIGYLVARRLASRHALRTLARRSIISLRPEIEAALDELATTAR